MATGQAATPNVKRQREDDEDEHRDKSQRVESPDESAEPTRIIDLNDDCLVKIFGYLKIKGLLNVALANKYLQPAARDVYKRKFGKKPVEIYGCDDSRVNTRAHASGHCRNNRAFSAVAPKELPGYIRISGLKTTLQYLRCLGSSIDNLEIHYDRSESKRYGYVHQYINDYCAKNLKDITFEEMPNIAVEQFQKVFASVTEITVRDCDFKQQPSFANWFPNVRRFVLIGTRSELAVVVEPFVVQPFRHLDDLCIIAFGERSLKRFADLLRVHRQLKKLEINIRSWRISMDSILRLIKHNHMITELDVSRDEHYYTNQVHSPDVQQLTTEHPALIKLKFPSYMLTAADTIALIGQLNSLKEFHFGMLVSEYTKLIELLRSGFHAWNVQYAGSVVQLSFNRR